MNMKQQQPLYSVGVWDHDRESYVSVRLVVPCFNITWNELRAALKDLRQLGHPCRRKRYGTNDSSVLVERTDGKHWKEIRKGWKRGIRKWKTKTK